MTESQKDRHQEKPYPLRLPADLRAYLATAATKNGVSLNSEFKLRLEESVRLERENAKSEVSNHEVIETLTRMAAQLGLDSRDIVPDSFSSTSPKQGLSDRLKNIQSNSYKARLAEVEKLAGNIQGMQKKLDEILEKLPKDSQAKADKKN